MCLPLSWSFGPEDTRGPAQQLREELFEGLCEGLCPLCGPVLLFPNRVKNTY